MAKHTPGPWEVHKGLMYLHEWDVTSRHDWTQSDAYNCPEGHFVATVHEVTPESHEANARLIAAAPELLEVANIAQKWASWIEGVSADMEYDEASHADFIRKRDFINRVIAKAEGAPTP